MTAVRSGKKKPRLCGSLETFALFLFLLVAVFDQILRCASHRWMGDGWEIGSRANFFRSSLLPTHFNMSNFGGGSAQLPSFLCRDFSYLDLSFIRLISLAGDVLQIACFQRNLLLSPALHPPPPPPDVWKRKTDLWRVLFALPHPFPHLSRPSTHQIFFFAGWVGCSLLPLFFAERKINVLPGSPGRMRRRKGWGRRGIFWRKRRN